MFQTGEVFDYWTCRWESRWLFDHDVGQINDEFHKEYISDNKNTFLDNIFMVFFLDIKEDQMRERKISSYEDQEQEKNLTLKLINTKQS